MLSYLNNDMSRSKFAYRIETSGAYAQTGTLIFPNAAEAACPFTMMHTWLLYGQYRRILFPGFTWDMMPYPIFVRAFSLLQNTREYGVSLSKRHVE